MKGKLQITDVEYRYIRDDSVRPDGPRDVVVGILGADIHCESCGRGWRAASGRRRDQFRETTDGFEIECPGCGERGIIRRPRD